MPGFRRVKGFSEKTKKVIARTLISSSSFPVGHRQRVYAGTKKIQSSFANRKADTTSTRKQKPTTQRFSTKVWEFQYIQPTESHRQTRNMNGDLAQHGKKTKVFRKIINYYQMRVEGSIQLPTRVSRLVLDQLAPYRVK